MGCSTNEPGTWVQADYLLWWLRPGPLAVPLVTTGSINDPRPGAIGQPNTLVLGPSRLDYGVASGGRLTVGTWLYGDGVLGIEAGGFLLSQVGMSQTFASDASGNPLLARPALLPNGTPVAYNTALDAALAGSLQLSSTSQLGGFELNGVTDLVRSEGMSVSLLAGFRFLQLNEDLRIAESYRTLQGGIFTFGGVPTPQDSVFAVNDAFLTRNRFYGGQIGARVDGRLGLLSLGLQGKLGLGSTFHTLQIDGASAVTLPDGNRQVLPGGVLSQLSNIGTHQSSRLSLVPELGVDAGMQLTSWLSLRVGYQLMCWTGVMRPGQQIDPVINPNQVPTDSNFGQAPGGPSRPAVLGQRTDFWAQGLSVGLKIEF